MLVGGHMWLCGKEKNPKKLIITFLKIWFKGCGMGPWLVLVSPCFRENVVATCKIGSFWCSLDNLLQKNVIVELFLVTDHNPHTRHMMWICRSLVFLFSFCFSWISFHVCLFCYWFFCKESKSFFFLILIKILFFRIWLNDM